MNSKPHPEVKDAAAASSASTVGRRGLVAGVGIAGAVAVTAKIIGQGSTDPSEKGQAAGASTEPQGYRLTAHVQRYYETTKA